MHCDCERRACLWRLSACSVCVRNILKGAASGRVFAVEMAFYTVAETVSGLGGGAMFDGLHLSTQGVSAVMAVVAAVVTVRSLCLVCVLCLSWPLHEQHPCLATALTICALTGISGAATAFVCLTL